MTSIVKRLVGGAFCAFLMVAAGGGTAMAGEITGDGVPKPVNGASVCAYSGQNDGYHDGTEPQQRVQSPGQGVRDGSPAGIPGRACNPS